MAWKIAELIEKQQTHRKIAEKNVDSQLLRKDMLLQENYNY